MSVLISRLPRAGTLIGPPRARVWPGDWPLLFGSAVAVASALFLLGTAGRARQKLLWHDEIFTIAMARLPAGDVWGALADGVDLIPPGFHYIVQATHAALGEGPIAARLPAMAGVLLAAVCAGVFVRRRHGALAGVAAMLILLCSGAYPYAYEARPYGLELGFAAAAVVCWQSAVSMSRRGLWLVGISASLIGAIGCHYYAVLLLIPLAAAEAVRLRRTRRADWPLWIAIAASVVPLALCWRLIESGLQFSAGHFSPASLRIVASTFSSTLSALAVPLLAALLAAGVLARGRPSEAPARRAAPESAPHEWALAASLTLLPAFAYVLALAWTRALVPRYCLPWTIGFSLLVPMTIARLSRHSGRALAVLAAVLFVWFGGRQAASARWLVRPTPDLAAVYPVLATGAPGDRPIAIAHPHVYLLAVYHAPPALRRRLVWLALPDDSRDRTDTSLRAFRALATRMPLRIETFESFRQTRPRFFVYGPASSPALIRLREAGAHLEYRGTDEEVQRFAISRPGPNLLFEVTAGAPGAHPPAASP